MKRFIQFICLILVLSTVLAVPAAATATPRESYYFSSRLGYLYKTSSTEFQVWAEVVAVGMMDQLGASSITVQRSTDNSNWTSMKTYTKEEYPELVCANTFSYDTYVTYTGTSGYYYRAIIWFYAKKGTGSAEYPYTTDSILL